MNESVEYRATVVVVPTRNRAALAMNAVRSVLGQPVSRLYVLVSDNSTSDDESLALSRFCAETADTRLCCVRPPAPLPMSKHWNWAIRRALDVFDATHFVYLTDRMMFRPGALKEIVEIALLYPEKVITYCHDRIVDDKKPVRIEQYASTGRLLEIDSLHLSYLYSQARVHQCLPRMLNSLVPRCALDAVRERFGNFFDSIAPDFNFGFRCLEMFDSILYYDKSPIFHYALDRSNGASASRGELTRDYADFIANLPVDDSIRNYATPIPQIRTAANAIFNEYCLLKETTHSRRFFELNKERYLSYLYSELEEIEDPNLRAQMRRTLEAHGTVADEARPTARTAVSRIMRKLLSPTAVLNKIRRTIMRVATRPEMRDTWLFLARHFGIKPPDDHRFEFDTVEEAIAYLQEFPRRNNESLFYIQHLRGHELSFANGRQRTRTSVIDPA